MSGCMAIVAAPFVLAAILVARARARQSEPHQRLVAMLQAFIFREDQSKRLVHHIHALLLQHFHSEPEYERLTTAVASFVPNGQPPFLNEKGLAMEFRHFLKMPQEDEGAWPPPPAVRP